MNIIRILKSVFNIGNSYDLSNFIKKQIDNGLLFEHRLPFMDILDSRNLIFYKTDISTKTMWINFTNNLSDMEVIKCYRSIIIIDQNKIITVLFEWSGLYDLVHLFEKFKDSGMSRKLFIVKYDIDKCLSYLSEKFSEVVSEFDGLVVTGEKIELFNRIIPDKAVLKHKLVEIPIEDRIPIEKIDIYIDPSCTITSVRLYNKHPNADPNGWYCLGDIKFSPLCVDSINRLIEQIKCYHLNDCYWKPKNYKEWMNSQSI